MRIFSEDNLLSRMIEENAKDGRTNKKESKYLNGV